MDAMKQELVSKNAKIQTTARQVEKLRMEADQEQIQKVMEINALKKQLAKRGDLIAKLVARYWSLHAL